jgi:hypothetical protein
MDLSFSEVEKQMLFPGLHWYPAADYIAFDKIGVGVNDYFMA